MKKRVLILLLCVVLIASLAWAGKLRRGGGVAATGCTKGLTIFAETFEAIADGEEWANDGNWAEGGSTTNIFVGDDAFFNGGSLSGLITQFTNGYGIVRSFTERTTGYTTLDLYIRFDVVNATITDPVIMADGTTGTAGNQRVRLQVSADGNLQIESNTTFTTIAAVSADTWYHLEIQVNHSQTDGIGAIRAWIDGTESVNSPFDTKSRTNPAGIDGIAAFTDNSTNANYWWDDVLYYAGERCAS